MTATQTEQPATTTKQVETATKTTQSGPKRTTTQRGGDNNESEKKRTDDAEIGTQDEIGAEGAQKRKECCFILIN